MKPEPSATGWPSRSVGMKEFTRTITIFTLKLPAQPPPGFIAHL